MEYVIDVDIIGEILIPLENNIDKNNKTFKNLESIIEKNFNDFRSIIFQGEVLRFFLVLKIDSPNNIENLLEEMFFKLEFDPSCDMDEIESVKGDDIENDLGFPNDTDNNNLFEDFEKPKYTDLFSIHRNTLFTTSDFNKKLEEFDADNNSCSNNNCNNNKEKEKEKEKSSFTYKNLNHEFVSRKFFFKEKKIAVFEILKHIIVPNKFLNRNLVLKINIMKKNNLNFMNQQDYSLLDIYTTSIYNDVKEFTVLKTLFKEVKIIRPLNISRIKQLDLNPEISLIEIKIENITSSINFIDRSLKNSKFLNLGKEIDIVTYGIDLTLRDIQILKEETVILNKTVLYFKNQEECKFGLNKENINMENLNFGIINSDFPIELKSGEELILLVKIIKNIKDFDKIFNQKDIQLTRKLTNTNNNRKISDKTLNLVKQNSATLTSSSKKKDECLATIANSNLANQKKNPLERSVTFTESQNNPNSNYNNYTTTATTANLKPSLNTLQNISNLNKYEHMGRISDDTSFFNDPLSDKLYTKMKQTASRNTECYREIFKVYPDDTYKKFSDIEKNDRTLDELREIYLKRKGEIIGNIVEYPLDFLKEENLNRSYFCKEILVPIKNFL